jgi:bis(5'-nucleosidyl)-tetraphosphatase
MKPRYAFEKSAGAVIFRKEGDKIYFLLLHYESGHWDFTKGHVEKEESETEALKREIQEETSIQNIKILPGFKKRVKYFYKAKGGELEERRKEGRPENVIKQVVYYLAETPEKEVKISFEHTGFQWLSYGEALKRITYKNSKEVLRKADIFLRNEGQQIIGI